MLKEIIGNDSNKITHLNDFKSFDVPYTYTYTHIYTHTQF